MGDEAEDLDDDLDEESGDDGDELEVVRPVRAVSDPNARRRVEEKLEELRLRRMTLDFDFD